MVTLSIIGPIETLRRMINGQTGDPFDAAAKERSIVGAVHRCGHNALL